MNTFLPLLLTAAATGGLWLLLERTHRRTEHLSRTPFGADLEGDRDITRTLAEIDAVRARQGRAPSRRASRRHSSPKSSRHHPEGRSGRSHLRPI